MCNSISAFLYWDSISEMYVAIAWKSCSCCNVASTKKPYRMKYGLILPRWNKTLCSSFIGNGLLHAIMMFIYFLSSPSYYGIILTSNVGRFCDDFFNCST